MNKKLILLLIVLIFLSTALFVGTPFEFLDRTADSIATITIMIFFILIFIWLFRQIRLLQNKIIRKTLSGLSILCAIFYLIIGFIAFDSLSEPMWQDIFVNTNDHNEKVITQFKITEGCVDNYRDRKIIADYGKFRISFDINKNLNGVWTIQSVKDKTRMKLNFDNKTILNDTLSKPSH